MNIKTIDKITIFHHRPLKEIKQPFKQYNKKTRTEIKVAFNETVHIVHRQEMSVIIFLFFSHVSYTNITQHYADILKAGMH